MENNHKPLPPSHFTLYIVLFITKATDNNSVIKGSTVHTFISLQRKYCGMITNVHTEQVMLTKTTNPTRMTTRLKGSCDNDIDMLPFSHESSCIAFKSYSSELIQDTVNVLHNPNKITEINIDLLIVIMTIDRSTVITTRYSHYD
ncbi:hypothetical protein LSH36_204g09023 [Paralvinella palmiformis]|uniref:Uncharacterized protein n=1 Tax=Paralvinella palmiformis TaxID=53620 RepID=A0AAD9JQP0_9ANNE|nr:hypothetical protein LSH36_204g09023 [Paralvinella palmiformis]